MKSSEKKRKNQNSYFDQKIFLQLMFVILSAFLFMYFISSIGSVNALKPTCYSKSDRKWQYELTLESTEAFDKMPFICRTFGYRCDSNHESLNPMQKEAMTVYRNDGKESKGYMPIIYKYSKKYLNDFFDQWFCEGADLVQISTLGEINQRSPSDSFNVHRFSYVRKLHSYENHLPVCPQTMKFDEPEWAKKCKEFYPSANER